jgi:DNA-binding NarL/FixJ family response regulator
MIFSWTMMEKIRLLLADDHRVVRTQMLNRLRRETDLEIVGEAANSMQAIKHALSKQPQVVLIDPMMKDGKGIIAIQQIRSRLPKTAIVVLTAFVDTILNIELRKMGVREILTKGIPSADLIQVLRDSAGPDLSPHSSDQDLDPIGGI